MDIPVVLAVVEQINQVRPTLDMVVQEHLGREMLVAILDAAAVARFRVAVAVELEALAPTELHRIVVGVVIDLIRREMAVMVFKIQFQVRQLGIQVAVAVVASAETVLVEQIFMVIMVKVEDRPLMAAAGNVK
jgi:hypothetical protein